MMRTTSVCFYVAHSASDALDVVHRMTFRATVVAKRRAVLLPSVLLTHAFALQDSSAQSHSGYAAVATHDAHQFAVLENLWFTVILEL